MEDLNKAVSLVFAIFHIDLGEFAILFDVIFKEFVSSSLLLIMSFLSHRKPVVMLIALHCTTVTTHERSTNYNADRPPWKKSS